jgi:hypothetical protein
MKCMLSDDKGVDTNQIMVDSCFWGMGIGDIEISTEERMQNRADKTGGTG